MVTKAFTVTPINLFDTDCTVREYQDEEFKFVDVKNNSGITLEATTIKKLTPSR